MEEVQNDTKHEAHPHARMRIFVGVGAVVLLLLIVGYVWPRWGDDIKKACLGEGEACTVEIPTFPDEENTEFSISEDDFIE